MNIERGLGGFGFTYTQNSGELGDWEFILAEKKNNSTAWPQYSLKQTEEAVNAFRQVCNYEQAMILKYEVAARNPWQPIQPDPPSPQ